LGLNSLQTDLNRSEITKISLFRSIAFYNISLIYWKVKTE